MTSVTDEDSPVGSKAHLGVVAPATTVVVAVVEATDTGPPGLLEGAAAAVEPKETVEPWDADAEAFRQVLSPDPTPIVIGPIPTLIMSIWIVGEKRERGTPPEACTVPVASLTRRVMSVFAARAQFQVKLH